MAFYGRFASIIIFSFVLSAFAGEAHVENPSTNINESPLKPVSGTPPTRDVHQWLTLPADEKAHVKDNMEAIATKTKEFITRVILRRLNNQSSNEKSTKQCLTKCYEAYKAAINAMQKAISDISHDNYYQTSADIHEFTSDIETCTNCYGKTIAEDPEFKQFQEWAKGVAGDCSDRLQKYID